MIHFSRTITPNAMMQNHARLLLASIGDLGPSTIWVQEHELGLVAEDLRQKAEICGYQAAPQFTPPWGATPKWRVIPRAPLVLGCDADILVWSPERLRAIAAECLQRQAVVGTIAYAEPLSQVSWRELLQQHGIIPEFSYQYQNTGNPAPFYLNNGAILMPASQLPRFQEEFYGNIDSVNYVHQKNYFMSQLATTVAIYRAQLPRLAKPRTFNYIEIDNPGLPLLDAVTILHYNISRGNIAGCSHPSLRARLAELSDVAAGAV